MKLNDMPFVKLFLASVGSFLLAALPTAALLYYLIAKAVHTVTEGNPPDIATAIVQIGVVLIGIPFLILAIAGACALTAKVSTLSVKHAIKITKQQNRVPVWTWFGWALLPILALYLQF